jgi:hypothetical protein
VDWPRAIGVLIPFRNRESSKRRPYPPGWRARGWNCSLSPPFSSRWRKLPPPPPNTAHYMGTSLIGNTPYYHVTQQRHFLACAGANFVHFDFTAPGFVPDILYMDGLRNVIHVGSTSNCFTEMKSSFNPGSYLRLIDGCITQL